ncbi:MAG TPA: hypothetical protein VGO52_06645 [Hyphomonadaceae bacterium]|jgi:hypothetical protein|nr:hypothetical protein [Hyphomonadaceae bacterium]
MANLRQAYTARYERFMEAYYHDEHSELVAAIRASVEGVFSLVFGDEVHTRLAMTAIQRILAASYPDSEIDWPAVFKTAGDGSGWRKEWETLRDNEPLYDTSRLAKDLRELHAFANYGIFLIWQHYEEREVELHENPALADDLKRLRDFQNPPAWVDQICARIDQLEKFVPAEAIATGVIKTILETRQRARARIKFDEGDALALQELSDLSGVTLKRLQNAAYSKSDTAPRPGKDGLIPNDVCTAWLEGQKEFNRSMWRKITDLYPLRRGWGQEEPSPEPDEADDNVSHDDYISIPVAEDGSAFTPDIRRDTRSKSPGFTIGAKGSERVVEDYDKALADLWQMEKPRWRRPNENGNWGIVTGQSWRRVRRSTLPGAA